MTKKIIINTKIKKGYQQTPFKFINSKNNNSKIK